MWEALAVYIVIMGVAIWFNTRFLKRINKMDEDVKRSANYPGGHNGVS